MSQSGAFAHSSASNNGEVGENLGRYSPQKGAAAVKLAVDGWYNEESLYNYNSSSTAATAHFTQLVWKASKQLGIGLENGMITYVVCRYMPVGNVLGSFTENVGPKTGDGRC